jgi:hypothetical protein
MPISRSLEKERERAEGETGKVEIKEGKAA